MRNEAVIVGGGWSVTHMPNFRQRLAELRGRYEVIAVNDSAMYSTPDTVVSMDRLWAEHRVPEILRAHAVLRQCPPEIWLRAGTYVMDNPPSALRFFTCSIDDEVPLSSEAGVLNGNNSGVCALNLAFQRKYFRVFLLGFDMQRGPNGEPYWYPPYAWAPDGSTKPRKYIEWGKRFARYAEQFSREGIELVNVTDYSAISEKVIPRWTFAKFLSTL
jgi:hypothetical protein